MTSVQKFKSLNPVLTDARSRARVKGKKIIKKSSVELDKPVKIDVPAENAHGARNSVVSPITENGEIVGIIHRCKCGEKTEIFFELEENVAKP